MDFHNINLKLFFFNFYNLFNKKIVKTIIFSYIRILFLLNLIVKIINKKKDMKKLSLKTAKKVLSRNEMKAITGGYQDWSQCWLWCPSQRGYCEWFNNQWMCRVG